MPARAGYLLKERVSDIAVLTDALHRINDGECVIDPTIVSRLLARSRGPLDALTQRERAVLALIAEGHSNRAIGDHLFLSHKTVEAHISHIFLKLGLTTPPNTPPSPRRPLVPPLRLTSWNGRTHCADPVVAALSLWRSSSEAVMAGDCSVSRKATA